MNFIILFGTSRQGPSISDADFFCATTIKSKQSVRAIPTAEKTDNTQIGISTIT